MDSNSDNQTDYESNTDNNDNEMHLECTQNCLIINWEPLMTGIKLITKFLEYIENHDNVEGWILLSDYLTILYKSWMRCLSCEQCEKSRQWILNFSQKKLQPIWDVIFWLPMQIKKINLDSITSRLFLYRAKVAYIMFDNKKFLSKVKKQLYKSDNFKCHAKELENLYLHDEIFKKKIINNLKTSEEMSENINDFGKNEKKKKEENNKQTNKLKINELVDCDSEDFIPSSQITDYKPFVSLKFNNCSKTISKSLEQFNLPPSTYKVLEKRLTTQSESCYEKDKKISSKITYATESFGKKINAKQVLDTQNTLSLVNKNHIVPQSSFNCAKSIKTGCVEKANPSLMSQFDSTQNKDRNIFESLEKK